MNPISFLELEDPEIVESFRLLSCKHYTKCLDFAAQKDWNGWTCIACPKFLKEKGTSNE